MFNLYQHMKPGAEEEKKETQTIGHDRFYQERHRSSYKKKRRAACRRAQSAADLNPDGVSAASKRNAFKIRSLSTDRDCSEEENTERTPLVAQKIDSLAKLLFNKSIIGSSSGKSSPTETPVLPKFGESSIECSEAVTICSQYLLETARYELIAPLKAVGSRPNKHWFAVHDKNMKTDRLLTMMPAPTKRPIEGFEQSRNVILEVLQSLHHPYIYPVLDLDLASGHVITVVPFNPRGSLKDLIYKSNWNEESRKKYGFGAVGSGLPPGQVTRFTRQVLEGLLFLKEKGFPPFKHLHSGNVIVQNGVARISGLENSLVGAPPRCAVVVGAPGHLAPSLALGGLAYEMCAGADLDLAGLPALEEEYPQMVEIIEMIFGARTPSLLELVMVEHLRKIDLREMRGPCLPNFSQRLSRSCLSLLEEVSRTERTNRASTPTSRKTLQMDRDYTEEWQW